MGPRLRQFADPTVICSIALLLLNDRVLKGTGPAWLTGKLSDFAGVFLVAMIVGIVTARPDVAIATTGAGFVMIKVSYGAAQLAAPVLGGVTRQDHTDLIALLALVPAWLVLRRTPSPLVSGSFGALLATTCLVFAGIGVTATSCTAPTYVDAFATDSSGALVARITVPDAVRPESAFQWARSVDGGVSWQQIPNPGLAFSTAPQACDMSGQCFRVIEGERIEQMDANGDWQTAFKFSGEQRRRMESRSGMCEDATDGFRSVTVVDDQPQARVLVAMGGQGVLVRTPDARWHRYAVLDRKPFSLRGSSWFAVAGIRAALVGVLLTPLVYVIARWRAGRVRAREIGNQSAIVQAAIIGVAGAMMFLELDYMIVGPVNVAAAAIALVISLVRALTARPAPVVVYPPPPRPLPPPPPPPSSALHR